MTLSETLAEALPCRVPQLDDPKIEARLLQLVELADAAWPSFHVSPTRLVSSIGRWIDAETDLSEALASVHAEELYLAIACAQGVPQALKALHHGYGEEVERAIARVRSSCVNSDDLRQIVMDHLLVGTADRPAALGRYSGRGSLAGWLRVTCGRAAVLAARRGQRDQSTATVHPHSDVLALVQSPEFDFIRHQHRAEFRSAFEAAAAELTDRQRSVLRQSIVNRLTVRQLGRMYDVHYATVSRWIKDARNALIGHTRALLGKKLGLADHELDEFLGDMSSQLDLTLSRILGEE